MKKPAVQRGEDGWVVRVEHPGGTATSIEIFIDGEVIVTAPGGTSWSTREFLPRNNYSVAREVARIGRAWEMP